MATPARQWELLEKLINRVLQLDEETLAALEALSGKYVLLQLREPDIQLCLTLTAHGILLVEPGDEAAPNVTLRGKMLDVFPLLFSRTNKLKMSSDMEIAGDIHILHELKKICSRFEPDWQEPLSRVLGDTATHQLDRLFSFARRQVRDSSRQLLMDLGEHLRYEKRWLPDATELEEFYSAVAQLRDDVECLEKRLHNITPGLKDADAYPKKEPAP